MPRLGKRVQERLEQIREKYGTGTGEGDTSIDTGNIDNTVTSDGDAATTVIVDYSDIDAIGRSLRPAGGYTGASSSDDGRSSDEDGDGDSSPGGAPPADQGVVRSREADRTERPARAPDSIARGPKGVKPLNSIAERRERELLTPGIKIVRLIRTAKDGKRAQVILDRPGTGGKLPVWVNISDIKDNVYIGTDQGKDDFSTRGKEPVKPLGIIGQAREKVADAIRQTPSSPPPTIQQQAKPTKNPLAVLAVARTKMSQMEADQIQAEFEEGLVQVFELLDKIITATTRTHPKVEIWSDMDDEEIRLVAKVMLSAARTSARVATAVRTTVMLYRQMRIAEIFGVRFYKTWEVYSMFGFEMPGAEYRRKKLHANYGRRI
jgi:hypothetical protein